MEKQSLLGAHASSRPVMLDATSAVGPRRRRAPRVVGSRDAHPSEANAANASPLPPLLAKLAKGGIEWLTPSGGALPGSSSASSSTAAADESSGASIQKALRFGSLPDLLWAGSASVALHNGGGGGALGAATPPLTHAALAAFVCGEFDLSPWGVTRGDRVALALPSGPHAALALVATMARCCAAPLNVQCTADELAMDLEVGALVIIEAHKDISA